MCIMKEVEKGNGDSHKKIFNLHTSELLLGVAHHEKTGHTGDETRRDINSRVEGQ